MATEEWVCSKCGAKNDGKFCRNCGASKNYQADVMAANSYNEQYIKLQIRQQEMLQEQEEKRIKQQEEKERKKIQYDQEMVEYNKKSALIPIIELKKWASSWVVLVLSILSSVMGVLALISFFTNLSSGWFSIVANAIQTLLSVLLCVGFWRSFMMGKSQSKQVNTGGPRTLRGVFRFYEILFCIIIVLIVLLAILLFAGMKSCADDLTDVGEQAGMESTKFNSSFTTTLVIILVAVILVAVFIIVCFSKIDKFANDVITSLTTRMVIRSRTMGVAILFFVLGGAILIGTFSSIGVNSILSDAVAQIGNQNETLEAFMPSFDIDVAQIIGQLVNGLIYVFGGILALQFGGLSDMVTQKQSALEKPTLKP